jgi:phosphatidylinositol alpha-mannosyltransferase
MDAYRTRSRRRSRTAVQRAASALGLAPADLKPHARAARLPSLERRLRRPRAAGALAHAARPRWLRSSLGGVVLALLALQKIGIEQHRPRADHLEPHVRAARARAMCAAMVCAASPGTRSCRPRCRARGSLADAMQGTMIGVLMSRRCRRGSASRRARWSSRGGPGGRARTSRRARHARLADGAEHLALIDPRRVMFSSVDFFNGHQNALLIAVAIAPAVLLLFVLLAPICCCATGPAGSGGAARRAADADPGALCGFVPGCACSASRGWARSRPPPSSGPGRCSGSPAICCCRARAQSQAGSRPPRRSCSRSTSPRCCRPPRQPRRLPGGLRAVLHAGWHVGYGTGVAYGVILQAVEVTTAILMGMPALLQARACRGVR